MEWLVKIKREAAGSVLKVSAGKIGSDIFISLEGGSAPHIGCVVQAIPRASLTGDGSNSATSSVLNLTGHKDEILCRKLAEMVCSRTGCVTVCTGGFHLDGIRKEQIQEVIRVVEDVGEELVKKLFVTSTRDDVMKKSNKIQ